MVILLGIVELRSVENSIGTEFSIVNSVILLGGEQGLGFTLLTRR
jgi:hypothetical protein